MLCVYDVSHKFCVTESPEMHVEEGAGTCHTLRPMNQHVQPGEERKKEGNGARQGAGWKMVGNNRCDITAGVHDI